MLKKIKSIFNLIKTNRFNLLFYKIMKKIGWQKIVAPLPEILTIEPTNVCTMKCPTCPTGAGKLNRPKGMMNLADYKKIIDQVRGYTKKLVLFNYGEPFMHPDIIAMIKYAKKAGLFIKTSTNGEFFKDKEFCINLVKSGLDYLIICLDGADNETLKKFRVNTNFDHIMQTFRTMMETKKELGSKTPIIELQFILMKHNEHQREKMKEIAHNLRVDIYTEKTAGLDINDPDFQKLAEQLLPTDTSLARYDKLADGSFKLKGEIPNFCHQVLNSMVINCDGNVVPCCIDLYSRHIMGNVWQNEIKVIWRGKKYKIFREQIFKNRKNIAMCNICSEGRYLISNKQILVKNDDAAN